MKCDLKSAYIKLDEQLAVGKVSCTAFLLSNPLRCLKLMATDLSQNQCSLSSLRRIFLVVFLKSEHRVSAQSMRQRKMLDTDGGF